MLRKESQKRKHKYEIKSHKRNNKVLIKTNKKGKRTNTVKVSKSNKIQDKKENRQK